MGNKKFALKYIFCLLSIIVFGTNILAQNSDAWIIDTDKGAILVNFKKDQDPYVAQIGLPYFFDYGSGSMSSISSVDGQPVLFVTGSVLLNSNLDTVYKFHIYNTVYDICNVFDTLNGIFKVYKQIYESNLGYYFVVDSFSYNGADSISYLGTKKIKSSENNSTIIVVPKIDKKSNLLITANVDSQKVYSSLGEKLVWWSNNGISRVKIELSLNGEKIISTYSLSSFNRKTGKIELLWSIRDQINAFNRKYQFHNYLISDVAFSPNGRFTYTTEYLFEKSPIWEYKDTVMICQYDLKAGDADAIFASRTILYKGIGKYVTELKPTINGKIAFANSNYSRDYLGLIHNPNKKGNKCMLDTLGIYLLGGFYNYIRLPNNPIMPKREINLGRDTTICQGDSLFLNPKVYSSDSISWQNGDTVSNFWVKASGFYSIMVKDVWGTYYDTIKVNVRELPSLLISNDTSLCTLDSLELTATSNHKIIWGNGNETQSIKIKEFGNNTVKAIDSFGCMVSDSVRVSKLPMPISNLRDKVLCKEKEIALKAGPENQTYKWSTGEYTNVITVKTQGLYSVIIGLGKCLINDSAFVSLSEEDSCFSGLFFPNAFTPNNDGVSDVFKPIGLNAQISKFQIFSTTGQKVNESKNTDSSWDGTCKEKPCPIGVYVFHIEYTLNSDKNNTYFENGVVHLMR